MVNAVERAALKQVFMHGVFRGDPLAGELPYSTTTAVPLADTISMPLPWPSTS